jgi:hypothetical protein
LDLIRLKAQCDAFGDAPGVKCKPDDTTPLEAILKARLGPHACPETANMVEVFIKLFAALAPATFVEPVADSDTEDGEDDFYMADAGEAAVDQRTFEISMQELEEARAEAVYEASKAQSANAADVADRVASIEAMERAMETKRAASRMQAADAVDGEPDEENRGREKTRVAKVKTSAGTRPAGLKPLILGAKVKLPNGA